MSLVVEEQGHFSPHQDDDNDDQNDDDDDQNDDDDDDDDDQNDKDDDDEQDQQDQRTAVPTAGALVPGEKARLSALVADRPAGWQPTWKECSPLAQRLGRTKQQVFDRLRVRHSRRKARAGGQRGRPRKPAKEAETASDWLPVVMANIYNYASALAKVEQAQAEAQASRRFIACQAAYLTKAEREVLARAPLGASVLRDVQ